jgi:hypothetical protein
MLLNARRELHMEISDVSRETGIPYASIQRAELGSASNKIVKPLQEFYGLDWEEMHRLPGVKRSKPKVRKLHPAVSELGGSLSAG